jgi:hypothetical protein
MKAYRIRLKTMHLGNPKEYWNILNSSNRKEKASIDIDSMFKFI